MLRPFEFAQLVRRAVDGKGMIDPTNRVRDRDWYPEEEEEAEAPSRMPPSARLAAWLAQDDPSCTPVAKGLPQRGWAHPVEDPMLFIKGKGQVDEVDPSDVRQGAYGDCYFLAAVAALARTDDGKKRIHDMIQERKDASGRTVYDVALYVPNKNGSVPPLVAQKLTVDAAFREGHAAAVRDAASGKNEIWPLVLEAAYAQAMGGTPSVAAGGFPDVAMQCLTGQPAARYALGNGGWSGKDIVEALGTREHPGKMVVLATRKTCEGFGLIAGHAYVVDGVADVGGTKCLVLRNPYGDKHPAWIPLDALPVYFQYASVGRR